MRERPAEWSPRIWIGGDVSALRRMYAKNGLAMDWKLIPSFGLHFSFSVLHSLLGRLERAIYRRKLDRTEIREAPIFVVGHWRSGTTLLHELLALDPRHTSPTTFQCLSPCHFLLTQGWLPRLVKGLIPSRRPADDMALGWDKPQEDEFALALLGVPSPYTTLAFPNRPPADQGYLDFEGLSKEQVEAWKKAFVFLLKRLTLGDPRKLVLKSPTHTARIPVLREIFPEAKFVHIVRDPYQVFVSTMNLWRKLYLQQGYQRPRCEGLEEHVFTTYLKLYRRIEADAPRVPAGAFHELRYEELVNEPLAVMRALYAKLGLGGFDACMPRIEAYFAALENYETNRFEVAPAVAAEISRRWGEAIRRYGYDQ